MYTMKPLFLITFTGLFLYSSCFGVNSKNFQIEGIRNLRNGASHDLSFYENSTTTEIIESFGYVTEKHHVVTEDGYILELHRIPYGINGTTGEQRPVAFLHHCLECSSADWIMDKPDRALGYLLADAGYDVWLTNVRGNTYSRNHTTLNPDADEDKEAFWAFTWGEMALYDAPAAIDYALATTGNSQLYYVGFSMGTSVFFAMMSERNEYKDKIKAAALLGPVAYNDHCTGPMRLLGNYSDDMDRLFSDFGHYEFWPSDEMWHYIADNFCGEDDPEEAACENMIFLFCGYDEEELNDAYVLYIFPTHRPDISSRFQPLWPTYI
ncbi:hypothetical protein Avbf_15707 [Armadillidium vulgare]|nr:hypothetical protein Avbf_15707 [Armadillidium vulgare]